MKIRKTGRKYAKTPKGALSLSRVHAWARGCLSGVVCWDHYTVMFFMNSKNANIAILLVIIVIAIFVTLGFFGIGGLNFGAEPAQTSMQEILSELQSTGTVSALRTEDLVEGTEDDRVFTAAADAVAQLSQFQDMPASEIAEASNFISANVLCVSSKVFMINSVASLGKKNSRYSIVCVVKKNELTRYGDSAKIVHWAED